VLHTTHVPQPSYERPTPPIVAASLGAYLVTPPETVFVDDAWRVSALRPKNGAAWPVSGHGVVACLYLCPPSSPGVSDAASRLSHSGSMPAVYPARREEYDVFT